MEKTEILNKWKKKTEFQENRNLYGISKTVYLLIAEAFDGGLTKSDLISLLKTGHRKSNSVLTKVIFTKAINDIKPLTF